MKSPSASVFEIVRIIDLQPAGETGFCVLIAPHFTTDLAVCLQEELIAQDSGALIVVDVEQLTAATLLDALREMPSATTLIQGLEHWSREQFTALDINRSRLETGAFLLFKMDLGTLGRFFEHAPNLRSFIGANIFELDRDPFEMGPQETAERLDQLRAHYGITDQQLLEGMRDGSLNPEPHFAEWRVLLGSSGVVR